MIRKTIHRPVGDQSLTAALYYGQDVLQTLEELPDQCVDTVCTSPPYWGLRDYGVDGQIGLENDLKDYIKRLVGVFDELKRVLKTTGTVWLNLGDSYFPHGGSRGNTSGGGDTLRGQDNTYQPSPKFKNSGYLKGKDLVGVPWRVAFALQEAGWYLRSDIVWSKPAPMPSSVKDRPTRSHEFVFLLSHPDGGGRYYYDVEATMVPTISKGHNGPIGGNKYTKDSSFLVKGQNSTVGNVIGHREKRRMRTVWTDAVSRFAGAHFACWPEKLVEKMVLSTGPKDGVVMDIFSGSAATGVVAWKHGCNYIGIDLNEEYFPIAESRLLGRKFTRKKEDQIQNGSVMDIFASH